MAGAASSVPTWVGPADVQVAVSATHAYVVRARSVLPGRQRWDVGIVMGQPVVARLLENELRVNPGIEGVRANPSTGRVLVFHNTSLGGDQVARLIEMAVSADASARMTATALSIVQDESVRRAGSIVPRGPTDEPSIVPAPLPRWHYSVGPLALLGGGALALALTGPVLPPLGRLGVVLGATAVVVWRGWRRSSRTLQDSSPHDRSVRHPVLQMVRSHRWECSLATSLTVVSQVLFIAPIVILRWTTSVIAAGLSAALVRVGFLTLSSQIWFLVVAAGAVIAGYAVVSRASIMKWHKLSKAVEHEWRTEIFAHVQRAELAYVEDERTSRLARVLTNDVEQVGRFLAVPAPYLLQVGTSLAVLVPLFVIGAPSVAWIAFLPVPVIAWLSFRYQEHVTRDLAVTGDAGSLLNSQLINTLEAGTTVKSFGGEDFEIVRVRRLSEAYRDSNLGVQKRTAAYGQTVLPLAMLSLAGMYLAGGLDVVSALLTFGIYNTLIGLPQLVTFQLPGLGDAVEQYQRAVAALARVLDLRDLPLESDQSGRRLDVASVAGEIVLEDVTFAYPGRPPVLADLSLRIEARKTTGIVGETGAGKTTIAKLLMRLRDVESGRVLLDGVDIRELKLRDLRGAIGFVSQDAFLWDGTVRENICYGSFDADPEQVAQAAQLAEAARFVEALPLQYETMVGERGVRLSGGQKQRISLARAIVKGAPIVILDEATSAVDNDTEAAIQHGLREFARDRTMVIIAHRLSTVRHADWIYVLGGRGALIEEGTHDELVRHGGSYAALWRLQIGEE